MAAACWALGQPAQPAFAVAAIKPDTRGGGGTGDFHALPGGRLTAENVLPRYLIQRAYGVKEFQVSGGPPWMNSDRFDIQAKAEGDPSADQMMRMLQRLLEDRFKLKVHRETKEVPVYLLSPARSGLKLPPPKDGGCIEPDPNASSAPQPPPTPGQPPRSRCGSLMAAITVPVARLYGGKITMADVARVLSNLLGRPVLDRTGFTEKFDLNLEFNADDVLSLLSGPYRPDPAKSTAAVADPAGPSIFTAFHDQLGIKLEGGKGPVEAVVIDHIEKPSGN